LGHGKNTEIKEERFPEVQSLGVLSLKNEREKGGCTPQMRETNINKCCQDFGREKLSARRRPAEVGGTRGYSQTNNIRKKGGSAGEDYGGSGRGGGTCKIEIVKTPSRSARRDDGWASGSENTQHFKRKEWERLKGH